jgi:hypothetical protein
MHEVEGEELDGVEVLPLEQAAAYLGVTVRYLTNLKKKGFGPICFVKRIQPDSPGCELFYKKTDLDDWKTYIESHPRFKLRQTLKFVEGGGPAVSPIHPYGWDGHHEND